MKGKFQYNSQSLSTWKNRTLAKLGGRAILLSPSLCKFGKSQVQTDRVKFSQNYSNKKLYRAFSRQANKLTLNIPVCRESPKGELRKAKKDAQS